MRIQFQLFLCSLPRRIAWQIVATIVTFIGTFLPVNALTIDHKVARSGTHYTFFFQDKCEAEWTMTRPPKTDRSVQLCVPAAFTGPYGGVDGMYVLDGKVVNGDSPDQTIGGAVTIIKGVCGVVQAPQGHPDGSIIRKVTESRGQLFQVFQTVLNGHGERFRDNTKFQRRGLALLRDGRVVIAESSEPISLTQFGSDLEELGAPQLANFDMGAWDEGWYRSETGVPVVLGLDRSLTQKQSNWFPFKRSAH